MIMEVSKYDECENISFLTQIYFFMVFIYPFDETKKINQIDNVVFINSRILHISDGISCREAFMINS